MTGLQRWKYGWAYMRLPGIADPVANPPPQPAEYGGLGAWGAYGYEAVGFITHHYEGRGIVPDHDGLLILLKMRL